MTTTKTDMLDTNKDLQQIQIQEKVTTALLALRPLPGRDFDVDVVVKDIAENGNVKTGFSFKAYNDYGAKFLEYAVPLVQQLLEEVPNDHIKQNKQ